MVAAGSSRTFQHAHRIHEFQRHGRLQHHTVDWRGHLDAQLHHGRSIDESNAGTAACTRVAACPRNSPAKTHVRTLYDASDGSSTKLLMAS